jgi:hypothetical protein
MVLTMAMAGGMAGALAGCAAVLDPQGFSETASSFSPFAEDLSSKAMSALTRADYPNAERYALAALRKNPKDPYALITAAMVYQATGRYEMARQYYEVIVTNQPQATITTTGPGGVPAPAAIIDVARANIGVIDKITGRSTPRTAFQAGRVGVASGPLGLSGPAGGEAMPPMAAARSSVSAQPLEDGMVPSDAVGVPGRLSSAEANVAGRFRVLKRLLEDGLITQDEFSRRRNANLAALLPYTTQTPPSVGLERPVPSDEQVVMRLKALRDALETRAITPAEMAQERGTILEALLPGDARRLDIPVLPPKDVIEAGAAVGRLERMRLAGLISADEAGREKDAITRQLDGQLAKVPVNGSASGLRQGANGGGRAAAASGGGSDWVKVGAGVLLATAKSEDAAHAAWDSLQQKFPEDVAPLQASFRKVDQGEKGVRWRVIAGPLKSAEAARTLCKVLKLHRQSCEPTAFERPAGQS